MRKMHLDLIFTSRVFLGEAYRALYVKFKATGRHRQHAQSCKILVDHFSYALRSPSSVRRTRMYLG